MLDFLLWIIQTAKGIRTAWESTAVRRNV